MFIYIYFVSFLANPAVGILQASILALYAGYLTLSALANEPRGTVTVGNVTRPCETFQVSEQNSENATLAVGIIVTFFLVVWSRYPLRVL